MDLHGIGPALALKGSTQSGRHACHRRATQPASPRVWVRPRVQAKLAIGGFQPINPLRQAHRLGLSASQ